MSGAGIAVHEGGLVVAAQRGVLTTYAWSADALRAALADEDAAAAALMMRDAFAAARADAGDARPGVAIAPPLAQVRAVDLPPMREEEARQVLARDAERYFVGARGPQAVALAAPRATGRAPVAAAAPDALVDAVTRAAHAAGWPGVVVVPAHSAWAHAAAGADVIVVLEGASATVMVVDRGTPVHVRRVRRADAEALAAALGRAPARLLVAGPEERAAALASSLGALLPGVRVDRLRADDATSLAARHAHGATALVLEARAALGTRAGRRRRLTRALATAAAGLAVAAAVATLWGERRELDAVRRERARLAPRVQAALARDASVRERRERVAAVARLAGGAAPSAVVARIATEVPADAQLVSLRLAGDTLVLEGLAPRAAEVVRALGASPRLVQVRPVGAFRRERVDGGGTTTEMERFTVEARVAPAPEEGP